MTNTINQNLSNNKQEYLDWKTILLKGEISIDKPIRDEFKNSLENWQEAIIKFNSDDKSKKELQEIKDLTEIRNLNLYKVIENLSKKTVNHITQINDKQDFSEKLAINTFIKMLDEFNKPQSIKNEVSLHFLEKNYKFHNNSHNETVAYIRRRILYYFITLIEKDIKKKRIENKYISLDDEKYENKINGKKDERFELLQNNIEYFGNNTPRILLILNRVLLNKLWCIKATGPTQVTSYLLDFLIHSNNELLFLQFNIDNRVKELIYKVIDERLRENKDRNKLKYDELLQELPNQDIIIENLRDDNIRICIEDVSPKRNNQNNTIKIVNSEDFINNLNLKNININNSFEKIKTIMNGINCDPKLVERIVNKRADNHIKVIKEEKFNYFKYFLSKNFDRFINIELNTCIQIYLLFYRAFFQTAFTDNEETQFRQLFVNKVLNINPNGGENNEQ